MPRNQLIKYVVLGKRVSRLVFLLFNRISSIGIKDPVLEYKFHPSRKWRFDIAFPAEKIAVEAEGGVWTNGAHVRGKHFNSDSEKYNQAAILGWIVLRYTISTYRHVADDLLNAFKERGGKWHKRINTIRGMSLVNDAARAANIAHAARKKNRERTLNDTDDHI